MNFNVVLCLNRQLFANFLAILSQKVVIFTACFRCPPVANKSITFSLFKTDKCELINFLLYVLFLKHQRRFKDMSSGHYPQLIL